MKKKKINRKSVAVQHWTPLEMILNEFCLWITVRCMQRLHKWVLPQTMVDTQKTNKQTNKQSKTKQNKQKTKTKNKKKTKKQTNKKTKTKQKTLNVATLHGEQILLNEPRKHWPFVQGSIFQIGLISMKLGSN